MRILVVHPKLNSMFEPLAQACYESFILLGYEVKRSTDYMEGYDVALFTTFHHPWNLPKHTRALKIGYHLEQLPWSRHTSGLQIWFRKYKQQQFKYDCVVDCSLKNVEWLRHQGYHNTFWCAFGYHPSFEVQLVPQKHPVPIRFVGFLGTKQHRRSRIIKYINSELAEHGLQIETSHGDFNSLIQNVCIHLNLHNYEQNSYEYYRIIRLMCNRQFVLTEKVEDHHPFDNKKHWVESQWQHMPLNVIHYINNSKEHLDIAEQAYQFIKEKHNFTTHLQRLLHEIGGKK